MQHARSRWWLVLGLAWAVGCSSSEGPRPDGGPGPTRPDGSDPVCLDSDGDGVPGTGDCSALPAVDCDDNDPALSPRLAEVCDGRDNDCDGLADEELPLSDYYTDADGDGYGTGAPERSCLSAIAGKAPRAGDCDDGDPAAFPGAPERCNQKDDDCDGQVDDDVQTQSFFTDSDGDGYGAGAATASCQPSLPGKVTRSGDCDDADPAAYPGAIEQCNGKDDDCDGATDESFPGQGAACATGEFGVCAPGTRLCVSGAPRCVRDVSPSSELCDGLDNDCDDQVDESFPSKGQTCTVGVGVCLRTGTYVCRADRTATECNATPGPPTASACDGQDNDCDGTADELELTRHAEVAPGFDPGALSVAPFFFTSTSCNGGQGTTGYDSFQSYVAAYVRSGELYAQELRGDGTVLSQTPFKVPSSFTLYQEVAIAQAGSGMALVGRFSGTYLDLYYVGPGPTARTLGGSTYHVLYGAPSGSLLSNIRAVRGNGGRVVVLWRETDSVGATRIRFTRVSFTGSGNAWSVTTVTPPTDLITTSGNNGAFGVASSHEEYGDSLGCPQGLARFAVAHRVNEELRLSVFSESGGAATNTYSPYFGGASYSPRNPDVAWTYVSGDRWAVAFGISYSADEALAIWQSAGSFRNFGGFHSGAGRNSVLEPQVVARPTEFLVSALIHGSAASTEPQVRVGRFNQSGIPVGSLTQVTTGTGCTGTGCANGAKKLSRPLPSASGPLKTDGVILYGGSEQRVSSGVIGCN